MQMQNLATLAYSLLYINERFGMLTLIQFILVCEVRRLGLESWDVFVSRYRVKVCDDIVAGSRASSPACLSVTIL